MNDADALAAEANAALLRGADDAVLATIAADAARFPFHAGLACALADALHMLKREDAAAAYRRAIALDGTLFPARYGLGSLHLETGAFGDAIAELRLAVALRPGAAAARCSLAEALFALGEVDPALAEYRRAAESGDEEARQAALSSIATIIPGSPAADNAAILAARRLWTGIAGAGVRKVARPPRPAGAKLRVAYASAFFGARNWMKPVFGVINAHDRARFEIHMISDGAPPSAEAGYADHDQDYVWQVRGMPNAELAARLAAAGIDVLVDLNGYSRPGRLGLFAHRPAPRQYGWFNMFATTGMDCYDGLIADAAALPPAEERFCSEPILRVPGSYLAFRVLYPVPDVAPPPCRASGHLTFGCLGSAYKITDEVIAAWAEILRAAPATRLFLKAPPFDDASSRAALLARFAAEGIAAARITLEGRSEHYDFLAAYARVDIALDTFPYNGGTTTTEALWQGVPVLSFNGDRWASRTSRSLLRAAGLGEWDRADRADTIAHAIALANDPATPTMLATLRAGLRAHLAASPVCDTEGLCRALEAIYTAHGAPGWPAAAR